MRMRAQRSSCALSQVWRCGCVCVCVSVGMYVRARALACFYFTVDAYATRVIYINIAPSLCAIRDASQGPSLTTHLFC